MSVDNPVAHTLEVLREWSEGFAICFVFSDTARCTKVDADVLYCASHSTTDNLVVAALDSVAVAARPVILNFYGCPLATVQEVMRRLNERRFLLERMSVPLVIVSAADARLPVQYAAPDLWHIRTLVPAPTSENNT